MKRKNQIFISSTYKDLSEDRQSAVSAILSAGHIPAGMELFTADNESQWSVIKKWIEESDIFLLILGARYGSIEPKSGKSYIQLEYEYAVELDKPLFAVVMHDELRTQRVTAYGEDAIELENRGQYKKFKDMVLSKMCKFYEDKKDIKLAIYETLISFSDKYTLDGWVSGKEIREEGFYLKEITKLNDKIRLLEKENEVIKKEKDKSSKISESGVSVINHIEKLIFSKTDLNTRVERILRLKNFRFCGECEDEIEWWTSDETEDPDDRIRYSFTNKSKFFNSYYSHNDSTLTEFNCLCMILIDTQDKLVLNLSEVLLDIRLSAIALPESTINYKYIVITERIDKENYSAFMDEKDRIIKIIEDEKKINILIEVWNSEIIENYEKELGLDFYID
jgi:hypothetical protein